MAGDQEAEIWEQEQSFIETSLDGEGGEFVDGAGYQCAACQQLFSAEDVYEVEGRTICVACYERARASATVAASKASNTTQQPVVPPEHPPARPTAPAQPLLVAKVTCPHCFARFAPQDVLWVSRHPELMGDPVAGPAAPLRFFPSRFNLEGAALDLRGMACQSLACPTCHLIIPRPLVEAEPLFTSIAGVSGSGKTSYLATMTWELRRLLPLHFAVSFTDADPSLNQALNADEQTLFLPVDAAQPVKLAKTLGDSTIDTVWLEQQAMHCPRPYLLMMRPSGRHPNADLAAKLARIVVFYDNAGDLFSPGQMPEDSPLTQHLGSARVVQFLYDPTQDPRFRARLRDMSGDPQLSAATPTRRQETVLTEVATRIRQHAGSASTQKISRPLLVVVPKADIWGGLINLDLSTEPIISEAVANGVLAGVDLARIEGASLIIREMLLTIAPEFVATAEDLFSHVLYIPISALGESPESVEGREGFWSKPPRIRSHWVTAPFLYMFARWSHDLIGGVRTARPAAPASS